MSWQDITGIVIAPDVELDGYFLTDFSSFQITCIDDLPQDEMLLDQNFDPFDPSYLEQARKRKSRWVSGETDGVTETSTNAPRRSRWRSVDESVSGLTRAQQIVSTQTMRSVSGQLTVQQQGDFIKLTQEIDTLTQKMANPQSYIPPVGLRSPSPEAVYDGTGRRINTREQRIKEQFNSQRNLLIEKAMEILPTYNVPGYKKEKPHCRVPIPAEEFPEFNFPGLIIGPRGLAHRRQETETGCKISIRGKGMTAENFKNSQYLHEKPHVFIQGDTEEAVKNAEHVIRQLQSPTELSKTYQQRQLRELAVLHGLDVGVKNNNKEYTPAEAMCTVCGSATHISIDCPFKEQNQQLDQELDMFQTGLRGDITLKSGITSSNSINNSMNTNNNNHVRGPPPPPPPPPKPVQQQQQTLAPPPPPPPPPLTTTTAPVAPAVGNYVPPPPPPLPIAQPQYFPTYHQQQLQQQQAVMYSFIPPPDFG